MLANPALTAGYICNPSLVMITQSSILTHPLIACLNHLADKTAWVRQQLQCHVGETACFRIGSLISLHVTITQDGHFRTAARNEQAGVILSMPPRLVPRLVSGDIDVSHEISICGDPILADILLYMGKVFQVEVEENLSSAIGDVLAHRVTSAGQELMRWHSGCIHNLSQALGEFFSEEQPATANTAQFNQLVSEVESLQQQVSRLEGRITILALPFSPSYKKSAPGQSMIMGRIT